ncbi:MAG: hypothetical protein PHQ23_12110 [Candidatus Wallbacteria bacterium]|nr:hypothetical protein [Candidatus Wallbacteria bacterium]
MGLAEKRAVKEFQDNHLEPAKKALNDAAGFEVPLEVDWDAIAIPEYSHMYEECFKKVFFNTVEEAFKDICKDEMGKEALKSGLKQVAFKNSNKFSNYNGITFENGVLTVDHKTATNIDDINDRSRHLVKLLEQKL